MKNDKIHLYEEQRESDFAVITKAKDLCTYVMRITEKSPKKFRYTFTSRLQNYTIDIIEKLYMANAIAIRKDMPLEKLADRQTYHKKAYVELKLLAYMTVLARDNECILPKQQHHISEMIVEVERLLYAWIKSDEKRLKTNL